MGEADITLLNEMLDRIQDLTISYDHASIYDQIWEKVGEFGIFGPPSTHLVATVEDLNDVLASTFEEAVTGAWSATSTYDVYMVDTLKDGGGSSKPPKCR